MCFCICIRPNDRKALRKQLRQNRVKFPRPVMTEITTTTSASTNIPRFYHIVFSIFDPILSIIGFIVHLSPSTALPIYSSQPVLPSRIETRALLDTTASFFLFLAVLQIALLRARPNDLGVWKVLQGAILGLDVARGLGFVRVLASMGRLRLERWRAEEWVVLGMILAMGIVRIVFLAGARMRWGGKRGGWRGIK